MWKVNVLSQFRVLSNHPLQLETQKGTSRIASESGRNDGMTHSKWGGCTLKLINGNVSCNIFKTFKHPPYRYTINIEALEVRVTVQVEDQNYTKILSCPTWNDYHQVCKSNKDWWGWRENAIMNFMGIYLWKL